MQHPGTKLAAILAGILLLMASSQARALDYLYNWSDTPTISGSEISNDAGPGTEITAAWYAYESGYHYFRMDLAAAPNSENGLANTYGFYVDSKEGGSADYDSQVPESVSGIDYIVDFRSAGWTGYVQEAREIEGVNQWVNTGMAVDIQYVMNEGITLEWKINDPSNQIGLPFEWLAATLYPGTSGNPPTVFSQTEMAVATPIPNALWLFGSGLVGLIGLKRRKG